MASATLAIPLEETLAIGAELNRIAAKYAPQFQAKLMDSIAAARKEGHRLGELK